MAKIKRYTEKDGGYHGELGFFCNGCGHRHFVSDKNTNIPNLPESSIWTFNGNFENPTIAPSLKLTSPGYVCHSVITNGKIRFCPDCTHHLAGQTIELPEIE